MRNISSWAIKNPIAPILLFFMLTIMGIGAFFKLPINSNPDIEFPAFTVSVGLQGAAPSELENQIATKVEGALASIEGVKKMTTTLVTGGSTTFVELQIGTDISKAVDDARAAVSQIRSDLPDGINEPQVARIDFNDQEPLAIYSVRGPDMPAEDVSWLIDREFNRQLLAVKGVGRVERWGGASRQITVDLDPARLTAFGATASQVSRALRSQNIDLPAGKSESGAGEQTIRALGSAKTVEELRKTPIVLSGGRVVRLSDIADVRDGSSELRGIGRFNDQPVVMFQVLRSKTASSLKAYEAVKLKIEELRKAYPNLIIEPVFTPTDYVQESFDMSMETLFEGALLATLVVAVFLGGWRPVIAAAAIIGVTLVGLAWVLETTTGVHISKTVLLSIGTVILGIVTFVIKDGRATFLAAIAIPLSTIPTFWVMSLLGFTLNDVTLLALALVAGILVDDAIVEIENIIRHIRMGKSPYSAALEAADEIGLAVVATTATIVAVFAPVSFMTGIVGQFFKSFGLTVAVAVLFSLLVARLITPLLAAFILTRSPPEHEGEAGKRYIAFLEMALRNRWKTVAVGVSVMIVSVLMLGLAPKTFTPTIDQGFVQMRIDLPPGLSPDEADARAREVAGIVMDRPETKSVVQSVNGDLTGATYFISLVDRKKRDISQQDYEGELRKSVGKVPGIRARFGGGWGSGGLSINLTSDDPDALAAATQRVMSEMRKKSWAVDLRSSADLTRPELHILPKREEAARLGVSIAEIATASRLATTGDIELNLAKFNAGERQIPILVRLARENRADIEAIGALRVNTGTGDTVPLSAVADIQFGGGEARITREDRQRVVTISSGLAAGKQLGPALEELQKEDFYKNPGPGVKVKPDGDAEELGDMFGQFGGAIGLGVLLIYCVLVLLFKDFLHPITILSVILLAPAGAFIALGLVKEPLSLPVMIGLLMLIGIVIKNSILLVDFVIEAQHRGVPRHEALIDAARKRSRPIIMTTIAMIAGMVPAAMTTAGAGAFRHGMAIAVIGGLTLSTVLSLIFVPAVYTLIDDLDQKIKRFFSKVPTVTSEDKAIALKEEVERRASQAAAE
ncbi:MAG: efflux RND transporter permease subunit [Hyphomonadaceae bacterium]|jgi:HAE1 family hydrophobic/amphiphilic exporter-1|uniref:efflux RND transporter permease subunit n=1 Tax=Aquidulcibacter sp. TaxID=2052990 RepID=UPI0022C741F3|nr:efflux RND transporter permease subunit [Aquidulcibacter sp.]MCE2890579.1 efflux RND transporter permease subunit [Hyphomonadaceae bacterium]MCZ8209108.1 efflux RND transporter permease subunit [Aquidulcibacter sp.]